MPFVRTAFPGVVIFVLPHMLAEIAKDASRISSYSVRSFVFDPLSVLGSESLATSAPAFRLGIVAGACNRILDHTFAHECGLLDCVIAVTRTRPEFEKVLNPRWLDLYLVWRVEFRVRPLDHFLPSEWSVRIFALEEILNLD